MSNTAKVHSRFWDAMRARFGLRWIDHQGEKPTAAWVQLLDRFTPADLKRALELMGEDAKRAHPPTLPEFEHYLRRACEKRGDASIDYARAHWRSLIVSTCLRHGSLLNLCTRETTELRELDARVMRVAMQLCSDLLDWACDTERKNGQRTPEMEQHINAQLWNALKAFRRDSPSESRSATVEYETPAGPAQFALGASGEPYERF